MSRSNISKLAYVALIAMGITTGAQASGDGGGGNERFATPAPSQVTQPLRPSPWQARPNGYDFAESTYRDGTRIRSEGVPGGGHRVTRQGPKGKVVKKVPAGEGPYAEAWGRDGRGLRSEGTRGNHNITPINRARW